MAGSVNTQTGTGERAVRQTIRKRKTWACWLVGFAGLTVFGSTYVHFQASPLPPKVRQYSQITHDVAAGDIVGTDGRRVFLSRGIDHPVGQVAVSGGLIQPVAISLFRPLVEHASPDGSTLLVASYAGGLTSSQPTYLVNLRDGSNRYLADAASAVLAPGGKSVVYFTAQGDAYRARSDGSDGHKWLSLGAVPDSFEWAPDGETILYSKNGELWEMTTSGSQPHELLHGGSGNRKCCGTWSPDGKYFVFVSQRDHQLWAVARQRRLLGNSYADPVPLTSGWGHWRNPVFSKDGKTLFANRSTAVGQLVRLDPRSNQLKPFLAGISAEHVTFSKDGRFVAYVSYPDGILWKANSDGGWPVQLSPPNMCARLPAWSPDGKQIVFVSSASSQGRAQIYLVSAEGGGAKLLLPDDTGAETDPSWSPDGRRIAFSTSPEVGKDPQSVIRIYDVASRRVTTFPGSSGRFSPRWSPDGEAVSASTFNGSSLYVFHFNTQRWSLVHKGLLGFFAWKSDSRSLYLEKYAEDAGIYRIPAEGGKEQRVFDLHDVPTTGYYGLWMGLDPRDAPLLMVDKGTDDVFSLTLE